MELAELTKQLGRKENNTMSPTANQTVLVIQMLWSPSFLTSEMLRDQLSN